MTRFGMGSLPRAGPLIAISALLAFLAIGPTSASAALPAYEGTMAFPPIQGPADPEEFSWEVQLSSGQTLEQVDDQHAEVYYEYEHHPAYSIAAEAAHDAEGAAVPTTLTVTQPDIVTLIVHHRAGNPAAGGAPFVYPITAGEGWAKIGEGTVVTGPPDEGELREERERAERENPPAKSRSPESRSRTCLVPRLKGRSLAASKRRLRRANCRIGEVRRRRHATARSGRVIRQFPRPGRTLPVGARVKVTLATRPSRAVHRHHRHALLAPTAVASASAAESPLVPPGFTLRASNGYRLSVLGLVNPRTGRGGVLLFMRSRHAKVFYSTRASVSLGSIEADLGPIGRIDVRFVPSGGSHLERSSCGKPVAVQSGRYEGTIDVEGEEGYSRVHATSARGEAKLVLSLLCAGTRSEGIGGHSPGARLTVKHRGRRRFEFTAMKNSPTRPARFAASIEERRGALRISRSVEATAAPGAFDFDIPSGRAEVRPPGPFSGAATYRRPRGGRARWHGDLSVDFPGRRGVRLTAPGTHASLIRAVLNPSHPF